MTSSRKPGNIVGGCSKYSRDKRKYCNAPVHENTVRCYPHRLGKRTGKQKKRKMSFYAKNVGVTLGKVLQELRMQSPEERYSLQEEVDLARVMTDRAVRLFDAACVNTATAENASSTTKMAAMQTLRQALEFVGDMVTRAVNSRAKMEGVVDAEQLEYITLQMSKIIDEHVGTLPNGDAIMAGISRDLGEVKMPDRRSNGGAMNPSELARMLRGAAGALDDTIGKASSEDACETDEEQ